MRKTLSFKFIDEYILNFFKNSIVFRSIILIILFSFNFFHAQQRTNSTEDVIKITLKKGAKIYSSDKSFNEQIIQNKIVFQNANLSLKNKGNNNKILIASSNPPKNQNLAQQIKSAEKKKRNETAKKIKEYADRYEVISIDFKMKNYHNSQSPNQFLSSHSSSKNYIAPIHNANDFSKKEEWDHTYAVTYSLHIQNYHYYNNKSLECCFSEIFSVRPPPEDSAPATFV